MIPKLSETFFSESINFENEKSFLLFKITDALNSAKRFLDWHEKTNDEAYKHIATDTINHVEILAQILYSKDKNISERKDIAQKYTKLKKRINA
jgi:hypothetical protein